MKERIALIWFSCFCCASENFRLIPAVFADDWIDLVFAVRHPLSAPTWEKPRTIVAVGHAGSGRRLARGRSGEHRSDAEAAAAIDAQ